MGYYKEPAWIVDGDGCHICISHTTNDNGYPMIRRNKKVMRLSRYVWAKMHGEIPKGKCILHSCDKRKCINPKHLHLGTRADNQKEMAMRNRGSTRLEPEDVESIRCLEGVNTSGELSVLYVVSASHIRRIWRIKSRVYV